MEAVLALPAFGSVERDHVVAGLDALDALANFEHDAGPLVSEDRRKEPFGIGTGKSELVCMADPRGHYLDQDLAFLRPVQIDIDDLQRLAGGGGNCGFCAHPLALPVRF